MARETLIVFVYDTVRREKNEALIYFHPTWVSAEQKTALCGQIIGTLQCVQSLFCKPEVVSLRSGNFFIMEKGRYLFAVGTDRNIAGSLLEFKAKTLYSLLEFLHEDFEELAKICQKETLSSKLCSIFDNYIKILVYARSIFSQNTSLMLTKSSSNVFMDAIQVLDSCQELHHVLGGSMMYHNRVVATQLSSDLTNRLILIDPYRNKCSAEAVETTFNIPHGVQLLQVYISDKEYSKILESSKRARDISQHINNEDIKKTAKKSDKDVQNTFLISAMKRDQSLIFTAVPEDSSVLSEHPYIPTTKKSRPKFLNLKNVCGANISEVKPKFRATTPLCGQTSVCSTPLKDLKKFVHQNPLKICHNNEVGKNQDKFVDFNIKLPCLNINPNMYDRRKFSSFSNMSEIYNSIFDKKSIDDSHILPSKYRLTHSFRTITDPTFPVFKRDGTAVSRQYCEEHIAGGSKLFQNNHNASGNEFNSKAKPVSTSNASALPKTTISLETSRKERLKKSMELALNSLNMELETTSESSTFSHYSSGVPQTPLMSKLSMVPSEENTESSSTSQYHKISALMNPLFPSQTYNTRGNNEELECKKKTGLKKCVLFVCGQKNIVLTMLLEEEAAKEQNTVKKMWDICTDRLSRLENDLRYSIESSNNFESEPYRYLQHDSEWLSVKRGGPWNGNDLESLHYLHDDFHDTDHNLTEILIRSSDNIIYGHHSGSSEVFYSETANFIAGLPPPVDPMGLLQIKAKKRLERDHGLVLI